MKDRGRFLQNNTATNNHEKNSMAAILAAMLFFVDRETAPGFEGMCRLRHMSPVFNARLARFFEDRETAPGFEGMCRLRHMSPVFNARLARFFEAVP